MPAERTPARPAATSGRPAATSGRFACFDGLRAIAALLVIAVHTAFVSGFTIHNSLGRYTARMDAGVDVFFVISGFLLYRRFAVAHLAGKSSPGVADFWKRRLRRIIPAYWIAFVIITYVMHADTVRNGWAALFVYLGFAQIYSPHYILTGITQAWSLCTEMSFYLFLPLYAAVLGRKSRPRAAQVRVEVFAIAALMVICLAYRVAIYTSHAPIASTMPNWLPGYIGEFALGMGLAVASAWIEVTAIKPAWLWHPSLPWVSWCLAAACLLCVGNIGLPLSPLGTGSEAADLAKQALYGAFGFFVVAPAVLGPARSGAIRTLLSTRVVAAIGVVSYGVYLWHQAWVSMVLSWSHSQLFGISWPFLALSVTGLALVSATLSYLIVERSVIQGRWPLVGSWAVMLSGLARVSSLLADSPETSIGASRIGPEG